MLRRHNRLAFAGSIHFITTVAQERGNWFIDEKICCKILELFEWYRARFSIDCMGYVLMPDHLHALLFQEKAGMSVPSMMRDFKKLSSQRIHPTGYRGITLWQDTYDDAPVPGIDAARTKLNYMHENPIRRGLVSSAEHYPWSSARDYAEMGNGLVRVTRI